MGWPLAIRAWAFVGEDVSDMLSESGVCQESVATNTEGSLRRRVS